MVKERWTTDGSGSTYIWGFLDDGWREGMTREACEALVTRAIALAMSVDGSSGGASIKHGESRGDFSNLYSRERRATDARRVVADARTTGRASRSSGSIWGVML